MDEKLCQNGKVKFRIDIACELSIEASTIYSMLSDMAGEDDVLFVDIKQLEEILPLFVYSTIRRQLDKLEAKGYIETLSNHRKVALLSQAKNDNPYGHQVCEWCKSKTITLEGHHYPVAKVDGGKDMVNICPSCHSAFHNSRLIRIL